MTLGGGQTGGASRPRRSARIEDSVGLRSAEVRRRLVLGLVAAVILLAVVATLVAWKLYDDAKARALTDLRARTVAVGAVLDTAFAGDVSTLTAVSKAPAVVGERDRQIASYLARAFPKGTAFTGGAGWIGLDGHVHASSNSNAADAGPLLARLRPPHDRDPEAVRQRRARRPSRPPRDPRRRRTHVRSPWTALRGARRQHRVEAEAREQEGRRSRLRQPRGRRPERSDAPHRSRPGVEPIAARDDAQEGLRGRLGRTRASTAARIMWSRSRPWASRTG